jgi:membrane associated rhomboid family serine protease
MLLPCFPFSTDAPRRHRPWGTLAIIAVQIAIFVEQVLPGLLSEEEVRWSLLGGALNPMVWLTADFLHGDWLRLLANLIFLWTFGLIVEGRLGWYLFIPLYAGLGIAYVSLVDYAGGQWPQFVTPAFEQTATLGSSAAVCAVAAMALVWFPTNDLRCFAWIWFYPFVYNVPIWLMALAYVVFDTALVWYGGLPLETLLVNLAGAGFGVLAAMLLLVTRLVDCQGWDLFSMIAGRHGSVDLDEMRKYKHPTHDELREKLQRRYEREAESDDDGIPLD